MRKFIRHILTGSMVLALSVVAFGCSGGGQETTSPTPNEKPKQNTTAEAPATPSPADDYPNKPIEVVVPAGAGGDTDRNSRVLAKYMEKELGQSLVISNVGGAGGTLGSKKVLDAKPDGYTVLAFHNSMLLNSILGLSDYSFADFEMAGIGILDQGNGFLVNKNSQFQNIKDLVEYAKQNPKKVSIATEVGGFTHLQLLALQEAAGIELNIVDVGGAADKIKALLGEQIDIVPTQLGLVTSYLQSGDFRAIGVLSEERLPELPDVPTFKEQGIDIVFDKFYFWAFPPETPKEIVNKFSQAMEKVVNNEDFKKEAKGFVITPLYMNPEKASEHLTTTASGYQKLYEGLDMKK